MYIFSLSYENIKVTMVCWSYITHREKQCIYSLLVIRILKKLWYVGHILHTEKSNVYFLC